MTTGAAADAREQLARLQAVTAALSRAATPRAIAEVLVGHLIVLVGADVAGVFALDDEAGDLELLAAEGLRDATVATRHARVDLDAPLPVSAAVRARCALWLEDEADWAPYAGALGGAAAPGAVGAVPILADEAVRGALFVVFDAHGAAAGERELVDTLARQAAIALERARLLGVAAAAAERASRLQRVAGALARALTPEDVGAAVAGHAREALRADAALIYGTTADGLELVAQDGVGDDELADRRTTPFDAEGPAPEAVRLRRLVVRETPAGLRAADQVVAGLPGAALAAPLLLGDAALGALVLAFAGARRFAADERDLAEAIAALAAQALDRCRLHAATEAARDRADRLQATTAALTSTLTRQDVARVVTTDGVAALGAVSGGLMAVTEGGDELELLGLAGIPPELIRLPRIPLDGPYAFAEAVRERRASIVPDLGPAIRRFPHLRDLAAGRAVAGAIVPLVAADRAVGALAFGFASPEDLDAERRTLLTTLAQLAAQALDRARLYEAEHEVASRLQTSLQPDALPDLDDADVAARYLPGTADLEVGGDWYDVLPLAAGRLALVVGDVVGRGLPAASAMGRLRSALAALAPASVGPADLLERVDAFARRGSGLPMATVAVAVVDPAAATVRFALAGHPPPVLVAPGGDARLLPGGRSAPLGAVPGLDRCEAEVPLPPGSTLVLYTDGLVERRGETLDCGLDRLVAAVGRHHAAGPEALCAGVVADLTGEERRDDVALLAVRTRPGRVAPIARRVDGPHGLAALRAAARAWLAAAGVAEEAARDVVLAVHEAAANALEHAGAATVAVRLRAPRGGGVVASVDDDGRWVVPAPVPPRGRGFAVMRATADDVEVRAEPYGTTVTLRWQAR